MKSFAEDDDVIGRFCSVALARPVITNPSPPIEG